MVCSKFSWIQAWGNRLRRNALRIDIGSHFNSFSFNYQSVRQAKLRPQLSSVFAFLAAPAYAFIWLLHFITTPVSISLAAEQLPPELASLEPSEGVIEELRFLREETVSIAAAHEQPISEAPSNVWVITEEDIRQSGAIDLPTVLRRIPGMEVMQVSAADFNVSVRGDNQLRANKLLVLLDGRSIYLDPQAEVLWKTIPVTLPEIERIEVLKGPASVLYGFNAFDGIINIITKSPKEMKGAHLQFGGGEFGTIQSSAVYGGTYNKLGYRLSLGRNQTNQWDDRDALAFRQSKFNIQTHYTLPGNSRVLVSGGFSDVNRFQGPTVDTVTVNRTPSQGYAKVMYERPNFFFRIWWTELNDTSEIQANPLISRFFRVFDRDGSPIQSQTWNSYNIETQHSLKFGSWNRLTYGLNYRNNGVSSNFFDQFASVNRLGLYVQDEWHLTETLTAVGGLRFDMDTLINPTYSPRGSVIYKPFNNHTIRATISVAFRPPTIFETFTDSRAEVIVPLFGPPAPTTLTGSKNLKPEEIVSYELGYQGWYLKHRLRTRLSLFYNHISNLIDQKQTAPGVLTFGNDPGSADIFGIDSGIEFWATPWLTGFANYSFQHIGQTLTGDARRAGPRFKANGGLRAEFENGFNGEAALHYYGAVTYPIDPFFNAAANPPFNGSPAPDPRVGSYILLNLRGGYSFWRDSGKDRGELAFTAFNALNDKHKEHPLGQTIASRVMGWLTIKLW